MVNIKNLDVKFGKGDLDNLIAKFKDLDTNIQKVKVEVVQEMAKHVEDETRKNLENTSYKDGNNDAVAFSEYYSEDNSAKAGMRGTQVLYDEFGTGIEGQGSPHPSKDKFDLKPYNSGRTIRTAGITMPIDSGILPGQTYWTYKDENGDIIYTQGIPAGKQVFNASESLKTVKQDIILKKVGEIISKL